MFSGHSVTPRSNAPKVPASSPCAHKSRPPARAAQIAAKGVGAATIEQRRSGPNARSNCSLRAASPPNNFRLPAISSKNSRGGSSEILEVNAKAQEASRSSRACCASIDCSNICNRLQAAIAARGFIPIETPDRLAAPFTATIAISRSPMTTAGSLLEKLPAGKTISGQCTASQRARDDSNGTGILGAGESSIEKRAYDLSDWPITGWHYAPPPARAGIPKPLDNCKSID